MEKQYNLRTRKRLSKKEGEHSSPSKKRKIQEKNAAKKEPAPLERTRVFGPKTLKTLRAEKYKEMEEKVLKLSAKERKKAKKANDRYKGDNFTGDEEESEYVRLGTWVSLFEEVKEHGYDTLEEYNEVLMTTPGYLAYKKK